MTQQGNGGASSVPMNIAEMMVAIGRIEQIVTPLEKMGERLTAVERQAAALPELISTITTMRDALTAADVAHQKALTEQNVEIEKIKATRREPVKFMNVVTIIAASIAIMVGLTSLSQAREARTQQSIEIEILKKNQQELIQKVQP